MPSQETLAGVLFLGLSSFFLLECHHYFETNVWCAHAGSGPFAMWPQPESTSMDLLLHATGMLIWMCVVGHQLFTRGRTKLHKYVGYVGLPICLVSLLMAYRPQVYGNTTPHFHGFVFGLSLLDAVLIIGFFGIFVEGTTAALKAKSKHFEEHRQHAIACILFTAAPGLFRMYVRLFLFYFGTVQGMKDLSANDAIWIHEMSLSLGLLSGIVLLVGPGISGHITCLRTHAQALSKGKPLRPWWHLFVAKFMVSLAVVGTLLFGGWVVDLLCMSAQGKTASSHLYSPGEYPTMNVVASYSF